MLLLSRRLASRIQQDESGQVTAWFIGIALILFGIMALSVDLGFVFLQRRTAQNAVDSAAIAGANSLQRCPLAGQSVSLQSGGSSGDPLLIAEEFAQRNLDVGSIITGAADVIQKRTGTYEVENELGSATWPTVKVRVDRDQNLIFARALGISSNFNVPAEAEAACGPISEGNVCPMWIEGDPDQEPAYGPDPDGSGPLAPPLISAYGLIPGKVYGMKVNNDSEHYGALDPPNGNGVNAWRNFVAGGCEDGGSLLEICEGCVVENQPGDYGNPVYQALEGGGPISDALYDIEKTYGADYPPPNLFPHGHLDCDLALTFVPGDPTQVLDVYNYNSSGAPAGSPLSPQQTIAAINAKTNPADMATNGAPCAGLRKDGSIVPELVFDAVQGRFMYIALTDGECHSACDLPVLGILRMYIVCWTDQQTSAGGLVGNAQNCDEDGNQPPADTTIYGVFADFTAPSLLGGGGLGTNPLAPFHVVLVR